MRAKSKVGHHHSVDAVVLGFARVVSLGFYLHSHCLTMLSSQISDECEDVTYSELGLLRPPGQHNLWRLVGFLAS